MGAFLQKMVAAPALSPGVARVHEQEGERLHGIAELAGQGAVVKSDGEGGELGRSAARLIGGAIVAADPADQFHDAETGAGVSAAGAFAQADASE